MSGASSRANSDRAAQVLVGVTALLLANCASNIGQTASTFPLNHEAPDFTANRLDGTPLPLSALRGRVVVLHLWAVWCEGCDKDLPVLDDLAARLKPSGVELLAVSLDTEKERLAPIAGRRSWRLTLLNEPTGRAGDLYQPPKLPAVYVIDAAGKVTYAQMGFSLADVSRIEQEAVRAANRGGS